MFRWLLPDVWKPEVVIRQAEKLGRTMSQEEAKAFLKMHEDIRSDVWTETNIGALLEMEEDHGQGRSDV